MRGEAGEKWSRRGPAARHASTYLDVLMCSGPAPSNFTCINIVIRRCDHRCDPSRRFTGLSLPWFSLSATQHRSCQLEFFSKKSFRHPVLACFVLVPAPAAPGPARFSVRGPWFLDTRVFGQTKTPEAQIPPGFPTGYDPVLPGKFEKVMR